MPEQIQIALDPAVALAASDLVDAWNGDAALVEMGVMEKTAVSPHQFHDPTTMLLLTTAIGIASQVVATQISDLIKSKTQKQPEITEIQQPDGSKIIIIKNV